MFKRIHWILTSLNGLAKFLHNRSLDVEIHCAVIKYEYGKAKLAHYLGQLIDLEEPMINDKNGFQNDKR